MTEKLAKDLVPGDVVAFGLADATVREVELRGPSVYVTWTDSDRDEYGLDETVELVRAAMDFLPTVTATPRGTTLSWTVSTDEDGNMFVRDCVEGTVVGPIATVMTTPRMWADAIHEALIELMDRAGLEVNHPANLEREAAIRKG